MEKLEIHIEDGLCKVIEGTARRISYTTPESLGLVLLKIRPGESQVRQEWTDLLIANHVALGGAGNKWLSLLVTPARERTITYRRGDSEGQSVVVALPATLMATCMVQGTLRKSSLWLVKEGMADRLTVEGTDGVLTAFPYGNVYTHGGICWGTTSTRDARHIKEVEEAFFQSGFNGDLFHPQAAGVSDGTLPELVRRVGKVLPVPPTTAYTMSVSSVVQGLVR